VVLAQGENIDDSMCSGRWTLDAGRWTLEREKREMCGEQPLVPTRFRHGFAQTPKHQPVGRRIVTLRFDSLFAHPSIAHRPSPHPIRAVEPMRPASAHRG
jgi:hypothetical protein